MSKLFPFPSPKQPPRRNWPRRAGWALLIYAIIGFLILPPIIRSVAVKRLSRELDREVSIETMRLNPFTLSATVRGLLIKDKDGQPFVSWDEVYVNFQLSSFLGKPWVFKEVSTTKPFVRVQLNKDYSLNFSDIIARAQTNSAAKETKTETKPAKPLALRIGRFHIGGASASFTDLTPRTPFARTIGPLEITLTDFRTDPDNKNPYSFAGTTDAGETFAWSGHFFLDPLRSQGELALNNITLTKYSPLYEDFLRFVIRSGTVDIRSRYGFELSATNRVAFATNSSFALHDLQINEPGSATNIVELAEFAVTNASVDLIARQAEVGSITGHGGRLLLKRDADAAVNVIELSKPADTATNAPGGILLLLRSVTNVVQMLLSSTNQWSGTIRNVDLRDSALTLEDLANARPARLELDQMSLTATNISNLPGSSLDAALSLRWNTNGTIKANVSASFAPPTADVELVLDNLELRPFDPYVEPKVDVFILDSKLGLEGNIHLRTTNGGLPSVSLQGDARLDDFAAVDGVLAEDLLKWRSVRVTGIDANLNPPVIAIKQIEVDDASARVVIETNRTINLLAALHITDTNAPAASETKPVKPRRSRKPSPPTETANAPTNPPVSETLPKISIASVVISNAQFSLTDRSLEPTVNLAVKEFGGTISGLSSEELEHATVDLHAKVEGTGPVEIAGTINPLGKNLTSDLKISVKNVDLTPTSPYSGRFAGYRIAKGKVGVELSYKISGRKLDAKNLIVLDQFTFGEKVESAEATKLPVKLGIAVLKDRNGRIELDVPVEGSLDDPEFHLGKVVSRAVWNVITKVLTSPFAVLGSMFGGKGEELSFQEFPAGVATLQPDGKTKLDALVKALYDRPALQLEIEGSIDPEADRAGLRRVNLEKQIRTKQWMTLRNSDRASTTPEQLPITPDDRAKWLQILYRLGLEQGDVQLTQPAPAAPGEAATVPTAQIVESKKGAAALMQRKATGAFTTPPSSITNSSASISAPPRRASNLAEMEQALLAAIPVTDGDYQLLAESRAKAVREHVMQSGKVEADRIFLTEKGSGGVKTNGCRALLQLK